MRPLASAVALTLIACGSSGTPATGFLPSDGGAADASSPATATDGSTPPENDAATFGDTAPGGSSGPSEVYGHSANALYKLDPDTKAVTLVGAFKDCSQVLDIALDKDSHLYGTTSSGLWSINRASAQCSPIATGSYPNSLSFVPAGTLDPNVEALVGYDQGDYVRIDPTTGTKSTVGQIGGGLASSGDIVSVKGGGTYLTVKGPNCNDCLIEVNPATGAMVKSFGEVGHTDVFGLAFWAGAAYGFDDSGELFEIDLSNASTTAIPKTAPWLMLP